MDYAKLLFASEARTLAMGMARSAAPAVFSNEEKDQFVIKNFRRHLEVAVREIEFASELIDDIKAQQAR